MKVLQLVVETVLTGRVIISISGLLIYHVELKTKLLDRQAVSSGCNIIGKDSSSEEINSLQTGASFMQIVYEGSTITVHE